MYGLWNHFVSADDIRVMVGEFLEKKGFKSLATKPSTG